MKCEKVQEELAAVIDEAMRGNGRAVAEVRDELRSHIDGCSDCQKAKGEMQLMVDELRSQAATATAPEGWQERTWTAIREVEESDSDREAARRGLTPFQAANPSAQEPANDDGADESSSRSWWSGRHLAAAALVLLMAGWLGVQFLQSRSGSTIGSPEVLTTDIRAVRNQTLRGVEDVAVGDTLQVVSPVDDEPFSMRIYKDETQLLYSCGAASPCEQRNGLWHAEVEVAAPGQYQLVVIRGEAPKATGGLDVDTAAVVRAGGLVELPAPVIVR